MSTITETEQYTYYTPTVEETYTNSEIGENTSTKPQERFSQKLLTVLGTNKLLIFNNGDLPALPGKGEHRAPFESELQSCIARKCSDIFTETGGIAEGKSEEWANILEISPAILNIMTSDDSYIEAVSRSQSINLVDFSIEAARNPSILGEAVISTGFGGSDDEATSTRLEAYTLPTLTIIDRLNTFYAERRAGAISRARRSKELHAREYEITQGAYTLSREEKKELEKTLPEDESDYPNLTEEEIEEIEQRHAVATTLPKARFFFGAQAAVAINGNEDGGVMDPDAINKRATENIQALKQAVDTMFPHIAQNVEYVQDIPWSKHKPYTKILIDYFADMLENTDDKSIQETLQHLKQRGARRGGENGTNGASKYAAIHPAVFMDRTNLPMGYFLQNIQKPPKVNITIGGRTERQFNPVREHISHNASLEGLIAYLDNKPQYKNHRQALQFLQQREQSGKGRGPISYRQPNTTISLITTLAPDATYYFVDGYDRPRGYDIDTQISELDKDYTAKTEEGKRRKEENTQVNNIEIRADLARIAGIRKDLEAIQRAQMEAAARNNS